MRCPRARVLSAGNDEGDAIGSPAEAPAPRFAWLGQFAKVAALAAVACAVTALLFPDTALAAAKKAAVVASTDPLWKRAISFVLHLDKHLVSIFANYGFAASRHVVRHRLLRDGFGGHAVPTR